MQKIAAEDSQEYNPEIEIQSKVERLKNQELMRLLQNYNPEFVGQLRDERHKFIGEESLEYLPDSARGEFEQEMHEVKLMQVEWKLEEHDSELAKQLRDERDEFIGEESLKHLPDSVKIEFENEALKWALDRAEKLSWRYPSRAL